VTAYALGFAIFLVAAATQAASGFGFALVALPLLALQGDPQSAVVASSLVSLVLTLRVSHAERAHVRWPVVWRISVTAVLGMPLGLLALRLLPAEALTVVIAAVTLACTVAVWRRWVVPSAPWPVNAAGFLSGVLTTATATNGPPIVAALQAMGLDPREFRATISAIFTVSGIIACAGFAATGAMTAHVSLLALVGLPAIPLGWWIGSRLVRGLDQLRFRRIVLSVLAVSASVALAHAGAAAL
jgi:uncharacterized membrane protein YfcA